MKRDFLDLDQISRADLRQMLVLGEEWRDVKGKDKPLEGKILACIFEKPSTRTRVSFDVGIKQLGGHVVMMTPAETQLGRNETVADTARVLSRYVDAIMIRTNQEQKMLELAENASVPVINGLTDRTHPCQLMADIMTCEQHKGPVKGKKIAWIGDGNNMATSWIHAATQFEFTLSIACPDPLRPPQDVIDWAIKNGCEIEITEDPAQAVKDCDFVVTDVWLSMSDEVDDEKEASNQRRHNMLAPYQVNQELMSKAPKEALFMHCLPAHRGEEVTAEVIDGPQSIVFDEAENRLHAQKGVMLWCLSED